jgi:heme A synthase
VPTWQGAIGLQIIHRMTAYAIAIFGLALAVFAYRARHAAWMTPQLQRLSRWGAVAIVFQVVLGIVNLVLYIQPHLTVLHQSGAIVVLGLALRFLFIARRLGLKTT